MAAATRLEPGAAAPQPSAEGPGRRDGVQENFPALLKASSPPQAEGKPVEIWFQDEARVGQQGNPEYIWAPRGSRPRAVRDNRRDSVYLFGALCPGRAVGAAVIMPAANSEAMGIHLAEISTQVAPDAHVVVLCDGAGWHQTGGGLTLPGNLSLLPIPPYSPELNPMENAWDYLRGNQLSHRIWDTYDDTVQACANAWRFLVNDQQRIRSIAHRERACVSF
jgi:transposase